MKSNKQRRTEIKALRLARTRATARPDPRALSGVVPAGEVAADPAKLTHVNSYSPLPSFYLDRPFTCCDCGSQEVWTAKQQKWWYEELQKPIDTRAVRCRACRRARRELIESRGDAANHLRTEVRALRALGDAVPTAAARRSIESALHSKWNGLRVTAVKTLCRWGDAQSVRCAREALARECAGDGRASACAPMAKALATHVCEADLAWVMDLYLNQAHRSHRWQLHPLLQAFGAATVQGRLSALRGQMLDVEGERELATLLHWARWTLQRTP
ncbi:MAG: zinc-ribbon domain containing protein [Inhella sp.]